MKLPTPGATQAVMKIVVAMDTFKGTIAAERACLIVAEVLGELLPAASISVVPMADGGEGTIDAMLAARNGRRITQTVTGPLPQMRVQADYAWFDDDKTAVVEMARASGLQLLSPEQYNPLETTTRGTGELLAEAARRGARRILLAVGGSATVDGGIGAAAVLGWRFLDEHGKQVRLSGGGLEAIAEIVAPAGLELPAVEVLCDVNNRLCGPEGAARVFAPQKGASQQMVERLEHGLEHLAGLVLSRLGRDIDIPGAGAAGGLAAGAVAFMDATLTCGVETVIEFVGLRDELAGADWVITGEGSFDRQSLYGKVVWGVTRAATRAGAKVGVIAGRVKLAPNEYSAAGIQAAVACSPTDTIPDDPAEREMLLAQAAARFASQHLL